MDTNTVQERQCLVHSPFFFFVWGGGGGGGGVGGELGCKINGIIKLTGLTFMGLSLKDFQSDRDLHL